MGKSIIDIGTGLAVLSAVLLGAETAAAQSGDYPVSRPMPGTGIFMSSINYPQYYGSWLNVPGGVIAGPAYRIETLMGRVPEYPNPGPRAATVRVDVNLPADADLYFNGVLTTQTGASRSFVSPPVVSGQSYVYDVRARWTHNGAPITWRHEYTVQAGDHVTVDVPGERAEELLPPRTPTELRPRTPTELRPRLELPGNTPAPVAPTTKPPANAPMTNRPPR